jgi:transposase
VFNAPGKRGRRHANDLRAVVDAILYIAQTGCQWRYLPQSFGPWTRQGRQARGRRRCDRPPGGRAGRARINAREPCQRLQEHLGRQSVTDRLELVLVDRGVTAAAARSRGRDHDLEVCRVGWDDQQPTSRPIRHAWRVEVARPPRTMPPAGESFENTTTSATGWLQVACIATTLRHLSESGPSTPSGTRRLTGHEARTMRHERASCARSDWARAPSS